MKNVLLLCAALAAAPAFADTLVARNGSDSVRLGGTPCVNQIVLSRLEPTVQPHYKTAYALVDGQNFVACWRVIGNAAHLLYEDGDQGVIPLGELKPDLSA